MAGGAAGAVRGGLVTAGGLLTAAGRLIAGAVREKRDKLAEMWASLRRPPREHTTEAERVEKAREEFQAKLERRQKYLDEQKRLNQQQERDRSGPPRLPRRK